MKNIISVALFAIAFFFTNCSSDPAERRTKTKTIQNDAKAQVVETPDSLLKFSILDEKVDDNDAKTQVALDLLLQDKNISEEGVKTLLDSLYNQIKNRDGFRYHENPTAIYIYAYSSKDKADAGTGQWVGMISKSHDETEPQIRINETQLKAVNLKVEERFGFDEKVRQDIWAKLARIELRAQRDADEKYPINHPEATEEDFGKNAQLSFKLQEKYQKELAREYKTTIVILDSISSEATEKGWALPGL